MIKKQTGGGYDFNLALSASSSATSGADLKGAYGPFFASGAINKGNPWLWPLVIIGAVVVVSLFLLRKY